MKLVRSMQGSPIFSAIPWPQQPFLTPWKFIPVLVQVGTWGKRHSTNTVQGQSTGIWESKHQAGRTSSKNTSQVMVRLSPLPHTHRWKQAASTLFSPDPSVTPMLPRAGLTTVHYSTTPVSPTPPSPLFQGLWCPWGVRLAASGLKAWHTDCNLRLPSLKNAWRLWRWVIES